MTEEARKLADDLEWIAASSMKDEQETLYKAAAALRSQPGTLAREEVATKAMIKAGGHAINPEPNSHNMNDVIYEAAALRCWNAMVALTPSHEAGTQEPVAGWQLVPEEPTKEMIQACIWALDRWREKHGNVQGFVPPGDKYQVRWRAMLEAAPAAPASHGATREALVMAISHIEHMAYWIQKQQGGYSFEALGEDMSTMQAALLKETK